MDIQEEVETPTSKSSVKESKAFSLWTISVILFFIVILYAACWIGVMKFIPLNNASDVIWTNRGQFGDMFGAVNALFSGLAFAEIIITILLQRQELVAQRQQLELNRIEVALTREEMMLARLEQEKQNETFHKQRFDDSFYNLLAIHYSSFI